MTAPERPLSRGVVTRYAIGSIGTGGFATLPGLVLVYYLTDTLRMAFDQGLVVAAIKVADPAEVSGVNTVEQLAELEAARRKGGGR